MTDTVAVAFALQFAGIALVIGPPPLFPTSESWMRFYRRLGNMLVGTGFGLIVGSS